MTDHQKRLWQGMIDEIQRYLDGKTEDFSRVIGNLAGALDASEIKDQELMSRWYDFWMPLEIRSAIEGSRIDKQKAASELIEMKTFLEMIKAQEPNQ